MGGNVFLKNYNVLRLNKIDYFKYCIDITKLLNLLGFTTEIDFKIIEAIKEKETFGDMDIVVKDPSLSFFIQEKLTRYGYPVSKNGNVLSFLYKSFQIDLIFVEESIFDYAWNYFNWNDVGNIIGRLSKEYGLKHGWNGLYYVQRNKDHVIKEHLLSTNYSDILRCMYLDSSVLSNGFNTYLEMFKWVTASPRFMPDIYKFENLNNTNRVRDKKRKTYNMFLEYLKTFNTKYYESNFKLTQEEKTECACRWFPFLREEIKKSNEEYQKEQYIKSKFNGSLVREIINLDGKELGSFIQEFKNKYNKDWILNTSQSEINKTIFNYFEIYNERK